MDFITAKNLIAAGRNKTTRKLKSNVELRIVDDKTFAIKYYATDILLIHKNGKQTLNNGGYFTVTTKAHLNEYSSVRIHQKNNVWYVGGVEFTEGMVVKNGEILKGGNVGLANKRTELQKKIRVYVDGFAKDVLKNGLKMPDGGCCWLCSGNIGNASHMIEHMDEKYYVPSLLANAVRLKHPTPNAVQIVFNIIKRKLEVNDVLYLKQTLRYYFRKLMPNLLANV